MEKRVEENGGRGGDSTLKRKKKKLGKKRTLSTQLTACAALKSIVL